MKGKYNMNTKQNLFTEEELAKVTDEAERKHLIECAQDQSKIDMKYMEIMSKYDLWEKGKRSRYFHATTHENAKKIMQDGVIRKGIDSGVYICKQPLEAARFVAIRGHETGTTLQEYEAQGGCEGCYFYGTIDVDGRKGCTFHWFDDESEDWEYSKNCDEISD